jgi:hypothetical protein
MPKKLIGYDVNDQPIYEGENSATSPSKEKTPAASKGVLDRMGDGLVDMLPMLAGASGTDLGIGLGTAVGGPVGGVAGGALGGIASYLLSKKGIEAINADPKKYKGKDAVPTTQDLTDGILNQLFESGAPYVGKAIGKGVDFLGDHPILRALAGKVPQQNSAADLNAIRRTPEVTRTVGEALGSKPLQDMERQLGGSDLIAIRDAQKAEQEKVLNVLRGRTNATPVEIGKAGQKSLGDAFASSDGKVKQAYTQFQKEVIEPNTRDIKVIQGYTEPSASGLLDANGQPVMSARTPIIETRKVELPVPLVGTKSFADAKGAELAKFLSPEEFETLPTYLQAKYKSVNKLLQDVVQPTEIMAADGTTQSLAFKEYNTLKEIRTQLGDLIGSTEGNKKRIFSQLSSAIDKDIEATLKATDPTGKATALRDKANALYAEHKDIYDPVMKRVYKDGDVSLRQYEDPSAMFAAADTDPKVARQLRAAFKPTDLPVLKTGMMSQAIDKAFDPASGTFNVDELINKISAADSPYKSVFTPYELKATEELLRAVRGQNTLGMQAGRAIDFNQGRIALAVGGALPGLLLGHDVKSRLEGAAGGAVVLGLAPSMFVNKILLNPTNARLVIDLAKTSANSPKANAIVQTLLKGALRGTQVSIQPEGKEPQSATIDKDGRLNIDEN